MTHWQNQHEALGINLNGTWDKNWNGDTVWVRFMWLILVRGSGCGGFVYFSCLFLLLLLVVLFSLGVAVLSGLAAVQAHGFVSFRLAPSKEADLG